MMAESEHLVLGGAVYGSTAGGTAAVSTSEESLASLQTFCLCFQRWASTNSINQVLPGPFAAQLADRVLTLSCCDLRVDALFNLRSQSRAESSATTVIFQFASKSDGKVLELQHVRKSDTDTHVLDLEHNRLNSERGRRLNGRFCCVGELRGDRYTVEVDGENTPLNVNEQNLRP